MLIPALVKNGDYNDVCPDGATALVIIRGHNWWSIRFLVAFGIYQDNG
jgi:hypothetical protein